MEEERLNHSWDMPGIIRKSIAALLLLATLA